MWKSEIMHVNAHMNLCCVCLSVRPETSPTRWPAPSVRGSLHPLITRHHPRSPKTCLAGDPCSVWRPVWTSFFFCSHSSDCDFVEFDIFFFFVCFLAALWYTHFHHLMAHKSTSAWNMSESWFRIKCFQRKGKESTEIEILCFWNQNNPFKIQSGLIWH